MAINSNEYSDIEKRKFKIFLHMPFRKIRQTKNYRLDQIGLRERFFNIVDRIRLGGMI